jgi:hypothetical protein
MAQEPEMPGAADERPREAGGRPVGESAGRKPFLLRLSPEILEDLRGWAGQEMRSLNGHIEYLLRRALEERKRGTRRRGE